ncbi:MAG: hypothetical protein BMS9Abin15_1115 [Gammaproteobacteria bacterium]|nr:MAG: hypothetical protein BMS9Abin15_1115 [Gammaproteobacteria bacterium]
MVFYAVDGGNHLQSLFDHIECQPLFTTRVVPLTEEFLDCGLILKTFNGEHHDRNTKTITARPVRGHLADC